MAHSYKRNSQWIDDEEDLKSHKKSKRDRSGKQAQSEYENNIFDGGNPFESKKNANRNRQN